MPAPTPEVIPIQERRYDWIFVVTCGAFIFTTFVPDITSVLQVDLVNFEATRRDPPWWPPLFFLEWLVAYARACDHIFMHNPPFFQAIMWGDVFFTGPFYIAGCYAFLKGKNWIRIPAFLYGAHVLSYAPVLTVIHLKGPHPSPNPAMVLAIYTPYWIFGLAVMIRLRRHRPFDRQTAPGVSASPSPAPSSSPSTSA